MMLKIFVNPLSAAFFTAKKISTFCIIPPHWHDTGSWNPSSCKTKKLPILHSQCRRCWCPGDVMIGDHLSIFWLWFFRAIIESWYLSPNMIINQAKIWLNTLWMCYGCILWVRWRKVQNPNDMLILFEQLTFCFQIFAVELVSYLSLQYALPKSLGVARLAINVMNTLMGGEKFQPFDCEVVLLNYEYVFDAVS